MGKRILKVIFINVGVLLLLLIGINFLLISVWEVRRGALAAKEAISGKAPPRVDPRALLPNYNSIAWTQQFFKEFSTLKDNNYKSYIGWKQTPFSGETITINGEGIRVTPPPSDEKAGAEQVVFLGGSTMWGTGVNDAATIPALFVREGDGRYRATNFGESGYRAMQSYIYLMLQYNKGLEADWVVSYDGVNEAVGFLTDNEPVSTYAEERIRRALKRTKPKSELVTDLTYWHFFLSPIEQTVARFKAKGAVKPKRTVDVNPERTDQVARSLLDAWVAMLDLTQKNGSKFLALLQPNAAVGDPNISHLRFDEYEQLIMQTYEALYERIRELLADEPKYQVLQPHFLDLTHSFDGEEYYYIDWCHVSPNGNEVIATRMLRAVEQFREEPESR